MLFLISFKKACRFACLFLFFFASYAVHGQFISRGDATVSSVDVNQELLPVQLLALDYTKLEGYGLGNVPFYYANQKDGHIVLIKGSLFNGVKWQQKYFVKGHNIQAVKMLQLEDEIFVLYNMMDDMWGNTSWHSGVIKISAVDGSILQTTAFEDLKDQAPFEAVDLVSASGYLVVCGYTNYYDTKELTDVYNSYLYSFKPSTLQMMAKYHVFLKDCHHYIFSQMASDGENVMAVSNVSMGSTWQQYFNVSSFKVSGLGDFSLNSEVTYKIPYGRISQTRIEFNPYNKEVVVLTQQLLGADYTGPLTLFSMDPLTLVPIQKAMYPFTAILFNSNISIDEKYIAISGANNIFDASGVYASNIARFDHALNFKDVHVNPYSTSSMFEQQRLLNHDAFMLFVTKNAGLVNWVYGLGTSLSCDITNKSLTRNPVSYKMFEALDLTKLQLNHQEDKVETDKIELVVNEKCNAKYESAGQKPESNPISSSPYLKIISKENYIQFLSSEKMSHVRITDLSGRVVLDKILNDTMLKEFVQLSGIYLAEVKIGNELHKEKIAVY